MWINRGRKNRDRVGDYWNAFARKAPGEEMERLSNSIEPASLVAIHRAHALHRVQRPGPDFAARLETELLNAVTPTPAGDAPFKASSPVPTNRRTAPPPVGQWLPAIPGAGESRRWALAKLASAVLILATGFGSYLAFSSLDDRRMFGPGVDDRQTPPAAQTEYADIPMLGGNPQRTGEMPGPGPSDPVGGGCCLHLGENWTTQAVVDDIAYFVGEVGLPPNRRKPGVAAALAGNEFLWKSDPLNAHTASSPAVANGLVYFGVDSGTFYALDAATGNERWQFAGEVGLAGAPVADSRAVYFATGPYFNLNPALSGDTLYFGMGKQPDAPDGFTSHETVLYAVDARTGEELWRFDDFPADSLAMYAFDTATGTVKWRFELVTLSLTPARAVVRDDMVFFGSAAGIYALDAISGEERWQYRPHSRYQPFCSTSSESREQAYYGISAGSQRVYFGTSDGTFYALDTATGQEIWKTRPIDAKFCGAPAIVGETLYYVLNGPSFVIALNASDGSELWRYDHDLSNCRGVPVVHSGGMSLLCGGIEAWIG
jgi:outer membrane protein assembly factor BamB